MNTHRKQNFFQKFARQMISEGAMEVAQESDLPKKEVISRKRLVPTRWTRRTRIAHG